MDIHLDCVPCILRQTVQAARMSTRDDAIHDQVVREVLRLMADLDFRRPPPSVAQVVHHRLRALTGVNDAYLEAKQRFNAMALAALPALRDLIQQADDPLLAAARFAVAANAIDMGVGSTLTEDDVREALRGVAGAPVHGDWDRFRLEAERASDILYLADNAGEIAVDRLVVEVLGPERVTVVVRGGPILNDATREDAHQVGLTDLVNVIDNGADVPGTILDACSPEFRHRFEQADLVIAKGQGNYETLSGEERPVAFWFKVKCPVVSAHIGLPMGAFALLPPERARDVS